METRTTDRLAAAFVLALMAIGALVLWIGVPLASLWAASKLTDSLGGHLLVGLPLTVTAMLVWGTFLVWLNRLYLRITGVLAESDDPDKRPRSLRGPLEPILVGSLILGSVALVVWFLFFAENPTVSIY